MNPKNESSRDTQFAKLATGKSSGLVGESLYFLRHNKKWWLTPIFIMMLLLGILVVAGGSGAAPFIYALF
jgi:Family of unknown function (DUF5989)